jgi:hypothetical protein
MLLFGPLRSTRILCTRYRNSELWHGVGFIMSKAAFPDWNPDDWIMSQALFSWGRGLRAWIRDSTNIWRLKSISADPTLAPRIATSSFSSAYHCHRCCAVRLLHRRWPWSFLQKRYFTHSLAASTTETFVSWDQSIGILGAYVAVL